MTRNELVKMAYAYGASIALQEAGLDQMTAESAGIKLAEAEEEEGGGMHPALLAALAGVGGAGLGVGGTLAFQNRAQIADALRRAGGTVGGKAKDIGSAIGSAGRTVGGKASDLWDAIRGKIKDIPTTTPGMSI